MFTTIAFILGFFLVLILLRMKNNKPKIRSRVHFKTPKGKTYSGVLRQGTSGRTRADWDFYDDDDDLITDLIILDYLFDIIDFEDDWDGDTIDYAIEDAFIDENISVSNEVYVEDTVYSDVVEETSVPEETIVYESTAVVDSVPETVAEPVYVPEPVVEEAYVPEPEVDVYETTIESKTYDSGSYDSGSYDSGSYDSGGSDD